MTLSAWRIVLQSHADDAFSGEGARLYGGRWNSPGVPVIYTAESRALAALEVLVHLDSPRLLRRFVVIGVTFDESLVRELASAEIPANWRAEPPPRSTATIGDAWVKRAESAILRAPSLIIPQEFNYVLNPAHAGFRQITVGEPRPFPFDPRLNKR